MKPIWLALCALVMWALQNVFLDVKLSRFSQIAILLELYLVMLPLALAAWLYMRATHQPIVAPQGWMLVLVLLSGAMYFAADYCFVSAYTSGGHLLAVSTIVVLFPLFSSIIRFLWVGGTPNRYHLAGYLLAGIAVVLLGKGEIMARQSEAAAVHSTSIQSPSTPR